MPTDNTPDSSAAARALGRLGGKARSAKNTKRKLSAIGKAGAAARWRGHKKKQPPPGE